VTFHLIDVFMLSSSYFGDFVLKHNCLAKNVIEDWVLGFYSSRDVYCDFFR
jgi:hypothetical protein